MNTVVAPPDSMDGRGIIAPKDWDPKDAYLETVSGRRIYLLDPDRSEVDIDDIANGVALSCRWSGQCRQWYSVAQHSMGAAKCVSAPYRLVTLMHDATEAYLTDMPTPAKRIMPDYMKVEHNVWVAIARKFGLPEELPDETKWADRVMLMSERDILKPNSPGGWGPAYEDAARNHGVVQHQIAWNETWEQAKAHFLEDFYAYGGKA